MTLMKKLSLFSLITGTTLLATTLTSSAQLQKGNIMIGANLADISLTAQNNNTTFGFNLTPKVGYFVQDNFALGGEVLFGINARKKNTQISYGVGALARYYVSDPSTRLLNATRWFFEGNVGIYGDNVIVKDGSNSSTNGLGLGIGPGLAYFISPNIALEGLFKYNLTAGFGNSATSHRFGIGVGFQIYLPNKKAKGIYNEVKSEVNQRNRNNED